MGNGEWGMGNGKLKWENKKNLKLGRLTDEWSAQSSERCFLN